MTSSYSKSIGLIVNPIAGMGGRVGLKGTDGLDILKESIARGARPRAGERTLETLKRLLSIKSSFRLITCPGDMGENVARKAGFSPDIIPLDLAETTSARDTRSAAVTMQSRHIDLLLFSGGDGTARDIFTAVSTSLPVVGIPAGVKIHSAVFAKNPEFAGEISARFIDGTIKRTKNAEVMDIDEILFRKQQFAARLFGYLSIPNDARYIQNRKHGSLPSESYHQEAIAAAAVETVMQDDRFSVIGPGTTTRALLRSLGLEGSLLGVDLIRGAHLIAADLNEKQLRLLLAERTFRMILSPVGGQGYILGRGNQQISPEVIMHLDKNDIMLLATPQKIHSLKGQPFLIDTGSRRIDSRLSGYHRVITGYRDSVIYKVSF